MARLAHQVAPKTRVHLARIDPNANGGMEREEGERRMATLGAELAELQDLLYAAGRQSLLVVLQGLDTAGKDGAIAAIGSHINLLGCQVVSFKVPTPLELAHDFLWRVHQQVPARGEVALFNRSHYEDVLVVRVHSLVPEEVWRRRYDQINAFEQLLVDSQTIIVKFYLHISQDEQKERLLAREQDIEKAWKLSVGDWVERRSWDEYIDAYEDVFARCSTPDAPWYIVPANRKWFRNLAITETLVETLRPYRSQWLAALRERGERELAAIKAARQNPSSSAS